MTFPSPSVKCFTFAVQGSLTLELAIAQFWSSGMGSHEATTVDFEVNPPPHALVHKKKINKNYPCAIFPSSILLPEDQNAKPSDS